MDNDGRERRLRSVESTAGGKRLERRRDRQWNFRPLRRVAAGAEASRDRVRGGWPDRGAQPHRRSGRPAVDTGFIVYNEATYPNLVALFHHLGVPTKATEMSFAVSLDGGRLEYGSNLAGLLAQPSNMVRPRFWSMMRDLVRFYREAPRDIGDLPGVTLGEYLRARRYGDAFRDDHLYPMAAAVWSTPAAEIADYPAAAFIRFCDNHGLLKLSGRPTWKTVDGGSRAYVERLSLGIADRIRLSQPVRSVRRSFGGVEVIGGRRRAAPL